jgi:quercetin dioxygenase-like cupin family protein
MSAIVLPGERTGVGREGRGLEVLLSAEQAGGSTSVLECFVAAGSSGPPVHVHPGSDETFLVLSGVLLVYVDGRVSEVGEGGLIHVTRGTEHTFATSPASDVRFLTIHTPGGFERFHAAAAAAGAERGAPLSRRELGELASTFDWRLAAPSRVLIPTGTLVDAG